ncbi:MAG: metal ABC transporter permease [Pirellulaceae bacterium]|nr:metal ABC transporter permease [Pirellulaceae bacterium]
MPGIERWTWEIDGWIVVAGVLCAIASSLLGNFLVLRKMSMLGDAISHAVLPGLAAAFLLSSSRHSFPMFLGAVVAGISTAVFTEWIRRFGQVDEGASMGVVFTSLFALGLIIIVQAADHVDLDPGCVLYGAIELTPFNTVQVGGLDIPRVVLSLSAVLVLNLGFVVLFYKELMLSSFDPALADTTGFRSTWLHYALMTLVAITAVASFESVGNILVVAMFVVPAAAASLLTDRLSMMIFLSGLIAALSAVLGHWSAIAVPGWFGFKSTTTAGMMAAMAGMLFLVVLVVAPKNGILAKLIWQQRLAWGIFGDDILAFLYRNEERNQQSAVTQSDICDALRSQVLPTRIALHWYEVVGKLARTGDTIGLTDHGREQAIALVRSHRLWEQYLVEQAGLSSDRIHGQAEQLEHYTNRFVREELDRAMEFPHTDPHGRPIPTESPKSDRP